MALLGLGLCAAGSLAADDDARFLEGLRQRRLFELAERLCGEQLADQQLGPVQQGELTVEWIRTIALHAAHSPPDQRQALWQQARRVAADFLGKNAQHPRGMLVRMQDALTLLAQGELARQELEAGVADMAGMEAARQALRDAARLLEGIDKELSREIPLRRRMPPRKDELSADELFSLQHHGRHQLARAYRNQALLYEPKSPDQISGLVLARQTLEMPLAQLDPQEPLTLQIHLDLAICQRLLREYEAARQQTSAVDIDGVEPALRLRARAEAIRIELAQDSPRGAQMILKGGRTLGGQTSADYDFATLETLIALWRAAANDKEAPAAKAWQDKAVEMAQFIEETHGPYWGRRSDQALVRALPQGAGGAGIELLSRTADNLYLKGEFDQAVAAYDQAATGARSAGNEAAAFDLAYKAALVQEKRKLHDDAATRFCTFALQHSSQPQAAEAHLRGAWNQAKLAAEDAAAQQEYLAMLAKHLTTWPESETAGQAKLWLGKWHAGQQSWAEAVSAYVAVPRQSQHFAAAVAAVAPCWQELLRDLARTGKSVEEEATRAASYYESVVLGPENKLPEKWTAVERLAALEEAKILLDYRRDQYHQAESILRTALDSGRDAPAQWQEEARSQLVVAIAGQPGRRDDALKLLEGIGQASPAQLLDLLDGLSVAIARAPADVRSEIAGVQVQAVELLWPQRARLEKPAALALERIRAEALAATGQRQQALAAFAGLAKANPDSGPVQEAYADFLLAGVDKESLTQALDQWRRILARARPRTELWFKAKYSLALAQYRLGDKKEAATRLRYTLETPPGLDGTTWKKRFEELLKQCEK